MWIEKVTRLHHCWCIESIDNFHFKWEEDKNYRKDTYQAECPRSHKNIQIVFMLQRSQAITYKNILVETSRIANFYEKSYKMGIWIQCIFWVVRQQFINEFHTKTSFEKSHMKNYSRPNFFKIIWKRCKLNGIRSPVQRVLHIDWLLYIVKDLGYFCHKETQRWIYYLQLAIAI